MEESNAYFTAKVHHGDLILNYHFGALIQITAKKIIFALMTWADLLFSYSTKTYLQEVFNKNPRAYMIVLNFLPVTL